MRTSSLAIGSVLPLLFAMFLQAGERPAVIESPKVSWDAPGVEPAKGPLTEGNARGGPVTHLTADLELVDVRLVDETEMQQETGPRIRLWVKNHSAAEIAKPTRVWAVVAAGTRMTGNEPHCSAKIESLRGGETAAIDLRLPVAAHAVDGKGNDSRLRYPHLIVGVDVQVNVVDPDRTNNRKIVPRSSLPVVDLTLLDVRAKRDATTVTALLLGEGFDREPGKVAVTIGGKPVAAKVVAWTHTAILIQIPASGIAPNAKLPVEIRCADGKSVSGQIGS